ncbi:photosystem II assembly protein Psb34 [Crocosphaera sp. XPORK-15E]|uniref:photosystem II assembly protein Psb34 n=1 Tax=Crocosphaera sp. XPORK-15E TaxID=3110247 RepID=UPI002B1FBBF8|nr:ssl1498 family light-harvesting-like protein [Crocosphaera sp. XPORK-15E]MEA5534186.1 ssl1498 family light-harvesting-like protein [Crocosphaera sp. XPORK-15E]
MNTSTKTLEHNYSDGSELIPAEVAAREKREGSQPPNNPVSQTQKKESLNNPTTTKGYTVDQEGLINNYPVTPKLQGAKYPTPREQYAYMILGGLATVFVLGLIFIAIKVS